MLKYNMDLKNKNFASDTEYYKDKNFKEIALCLN